MCFDITHLDKARLLKSLHFFGSTSESNHEYLITAARYRNILKEKDTGIGEVRIDRIGNVQINLRYDYYSPTRQLVYTGGYDSIHGAYCFLYALIQEFGYENIAIRRKGYPLGWVPEKGKEFNNRLRGNYLHLIDFTRLGIKRPSFNEKTYPPYLITSPVAAM